MSKSTPLSELQNSGNEQVVSTKPLVQDILKEIQQEETGGMAPDNHQPTMQPHQLQEIPQELDNTQMVDNSDPSQYEQQQEQALQYQLDPNINNNPNVDQGGPIQDPSYGHNMDQQMNPMAQMQEMGNMDMTMSNNDVSQTLTPKTLGQKIFIEARDPLLIMLISILLSVPVINSHLIRLIGKIPGGNITMVPICIKAFVTALLFYAIRKLF